MGSLHSCICGSSSDEIKESTKAHAPPTYVEQDDNLPNCDTQTSEMHKIIPKEKKINIDEPSVVPGISDPAMLRAPEEDFGHHLIITDDRINKQLNRIDTGSTNHSKTEEDRWFES